MAINYQKVGWDTTKYVNPTNMNKMDNGIKSACDGVDRLDGEIAEKDTEIIAINTNLMHLRDGSKNLAFKVIKNSNIDSNGVIVYGASFDLAVAKVEEGKTYTCSIGVASLVCAYFSEEPFIGLTSFDGNRVIQTDKTITIPSGASYIAFRVSGGYEKSQIELGSKATSYEPFYEGTVELTQKTEQLKNGSKNLLDLGRLTTKTVNGVTFTPVYSANGGLEYIKVNGTASANADFALVGSYGITETFLPSGDYTALMDGSNTTTQLILSYNTTSYGNFATKKTINAPSGLSYAMIRVNSGETVSNLHLKPIISNDSSIESYEPFFKGNVELTSDIEKMSSKLEYEVISFSGNSATVKLKKTRNVLLIFYRNSNAIWAIDATGTVQIIVAGRISTITLNETTNEITINRNDIEYSAYVMVAYM